MLTLDSLIRKGYFAKELPPAFTTELLANNLDKIVSVSTNSKMKKSKCTSFSIPRIKHLRRLLGIPNPLHQLMLCQPIVENWSDISNFFTKSNISLSRPTVINNSERALMRSHKFRQIFGEGMLRSTAARYLLRTDISRYYPTLYTHSIPWALHSKNTSKITRGNSLYGNVIDSCVRNTQDQQTIGIPVGPDTSLVISEIINSAIDERLQSLIGDLKGIRFMDDYFLYFSSYSQAEHALAILHMVMKDYELELNPSKTSIIKLPEFNDQVWATELRFLDFREAEVGQRSDLLDYFNKVFELACKYPESYVLKYAISRIVKLCVNHNNWPLYEAFLLKCIIVEPNVLPIVTQIFLTYSNEGYVLDNDKIEDTITEVIGYHSQFKQGFEMSWSLWLLKTLGIHMNDRVSRVISNMDDPVTALIALDLRAQGMTDENLDVSFWKSKMTSTNLYSEYWILAYEARFKNWLPAVSGRNYLAIDDFFSVLNDAGICFYDENKQLPSLQLQRDIRRYPMPLSGVLSSDNESEEPDGDFEYYNEMDDDSSYDDDLAQY